MREDMRAPRILRPEDADALMDASVKPALWTALVPSAGCGSRVEFAGPKILVLVGGQTILQRLVDLLSPRCSQLVFVLSPEGAVQVEDPIARLVPGRYRIALQAQPRGMADAVACGLPLVATRNVLVIWGDQVAGRPASLDFAMRVHQGAAQPAASCPTLWRDRPYVHFDRDESGQILRVLQAREADSLPPRGESDSGVFLFRTEALSWWLPRLLESPDCVGRKTGEFNFLPIFPMLDAEAGRLVTLPIMTQAESVGVNSRADAEYLERHLSADQPKP